MNWLPSVIYNNWQHNIASLTCLLFCNYLHNLNHSLLLYDCSETSHRKFNDYFLYFLPVPVPHLHNYMVPCAPYGPIGFLWLVPLFPFVFWCVCFFPSLQNFWISPFSMVELYDPLYNIWKMNRVFMFFTSLSVSLPPSLPPKFIISSFVS